MIRKMFIAFLALSLIMVAGFAVAKRGGEGGRGKS